MNSLRFENDDTRLLDRALIDAERAEQTAEKWRTDFAAAKVAVTQAESAFLGTLGTDQAQELAQRAQAVRNLSVVVAALEDAGGASEARLRQLNNRPNYDTLGRGLTAKSAAITALIKPQRVELGERRKILTEEGVDFRLIETDGEVRRIGLVIAGVENLIREADEAAAWCRRWDHTTTDRSFDDLHEILTRPLPTV